MLEFIRKHSGSIIVKIFLTILALTFVFCFGISDIISKFTGKDYVVKIGNVKISPTMFKYEKARKQHLFRSKSRDIEDSTVTAMILHQLIWENIIDIASEKFGFSVSDESLKRYISGMTMFMDKDGHFNSNKLRGLLQQMQIPEQMFLDSSKKDIKVALIKAPFRRVSINGFADIFAKTVFEKRAISYAVIKHSDMKIDETPSNDTLEEFYTKNQDLFMVQETRSFKILELNESGINVSVSDQEIRDAYDTSIEKSDRTFENMQKELLFNLRQEKLQTAVNELTRQVEDALMAGESVESLAKKHNLKIIQIKNATASQQNLAANVDYKNDAFSMAFSTEEGADSSFSETIDKNKNRIQWLVHVDAITPKHPAEFNKIIDHVKSEWKHNKQHTKAIDLAKKIVANMPNHEITKKLLSDNRLSFAKISPFNRFESDKEDLGKFKKFVNKIRDDVFKKMKNEATYCEIGKKVIVYKVDNIIYPKTLSKNDRIYGRATLVKNCCEDMYQELVGYLSTQYEVKINDEMLKQMNEKVSQDYIDDMF